MTKSKRRTIDTIDVDMAIKAQGWENSYQRFHSIDPDTIKEKTKSVQAYILEYGYNDASPGSVFGCSVTVMNLANTGVGRLYVQMWIGAGVAIPVGNTTELTVDTRFGCPAQPAPPGLSLNARSSGTLDLALNIPATIEKATYFFCLNLIEGNLPHGLNVLDRAIQSFEVK